MSRAVSCSELLPSARLLCVISALDATFDQLELINANQVLQPPYRPLWHALSLSFSWMTWEIHADMYTLFADRTLRDVWRI